MKDTPLDQPAVNESATAPLQTAPRWTWKLLVLGLLVGFLPLALTPAYYLLSALQQTFETYLFSFWEWVGWLLLLYSVAWVGAVLLRIVSHKESPRVFAKGMMFGLGGTVAIIVGLSILALVTIENCNCLH